MQANGVARVPAGAGDDYDFPGGVIWLVCGHGDVAHENVHRIGRNPATRNGSSGIQMTGQRQNKLVRGEAKLGGGRAGRGRTDECKSTAHNKYGTREERLHRRSPVGLCFGFLLRDAVLAAYFQPLPGNSLGIRSALAKVRTFVAKTADDPLSGSPHALERMTADDIGSCIPDSLEEKRGSWISGKDPYCCTGGFPDTMIRKIKDREVLDFLPRP